jgi:hypothetical protein
VGYCAEVDAVPREKSNSGATNTAISKMEFVQEGSLEEADTGKVRFSRVGVAWAIRSITKRFGWMRLERQDL